MFHFCTFKKILTIEKEQNAHTKGEGCYYLLLAVLTEKGEKSCSSVKNARSSQKQKEESRGVFEPLEEGLEEELLVPVITGMSPVPSPGGKHKSTARDSGTAILQCQPSPLPGHPKLLQPPNPAGLGELWPLLKRCSIINSKLNHYKF